MLKSLLLTVVLVDGINWVNAEPKVVCYHEYWNHFRSGKGNFSVESIGKVNCFSLVK